MGVSLEGIGISAACPGSVVTNVNVAIEGRANYDLVNRGAEDAFVEILAELVDSAGNREAESETFRRVGAGERSSFTHALRLFASYEQPGRIGVTMRVSVSGAAGGLHVAQCGFVVDAA